MLLGDEDAGPPELHDLSPQRVVVLARFGQLSDPIGREAGAQELARCGLDGALIVRKVEVHTYLLSVSVPSDPPTASGASRARARRPSCAGSRSAQPRSSSHGRAGSGRSSRIPTSAPRGRERPSPA